MCSIVQLKVTEEQRKHIIANFDFMAEAMVYPHMKLWGVFLGEDPVGFAMLEEDTCSSGPVDFYRDLGFMPTGDMLEAEIVLAVQLTPTKGKR